MEHYEQFLGSPKPKWIPENKIQQNTKEHVKLGKSTPTLKKFLSNRTTEDKSFKPRYLP